MTDPGQDFARLMVAQSQGAAAEPPQPKSYGMTRDKATGQVRQKKAAGRPRKAPVADPDLTSGENSPPSTPNQDPDPGWMRADVGKLPHPEEVSQKVKDEMTGGVGLMFAVLAPPVMRLDPYCGQTLFAQAEDITAALVPLMCKSSTVVKWFTSADSDWMLWIKLAIALQPVGVAVWRHDVTHQIKVVEDDKGDRYAVPKDFSEFTTEAAAV